MNVREATLNDIPQLLQLEQAVIEAERPFNAHIKPAGVKYYDLEALITQPTAQLLVMEALQANSNNSHIIATGYARIDGSRQPFVHRQHGYLGFMYVAPAHRGQGLNKIMLEALSHWCREKGLQTLYLDVYASNASALRAYEKAGFQANLVEMKMDL